MVESIFETILDIKCSDKDGLQTLIEGITLLNDSLKVGTTSHDNTLDIWDVIGNEILSGQLSYFFHI